MLTKTDADKLYRLLSAPSVSNYTAVSANLSFNHGDPVSLLKRKRKPGKKGVRYELVTNEFIGKGNFGTVYKIAGTLKLDSKNKTVIFKHKNRVVKIQKHNYDHPTTNATTEYNLSKKAPHLGVKQPTIDGNVSYSVMNHLPGKELFDLIDDGSINALSYEKKLILCLRLLEKVKLQAKDNQVIHRDIKPENILVDLNTLTPNLIDYGLSMQTGKFDGKACGTPTYTAPETFKANAGNITPKVDVFCTARVVALILGQSFSSYQDSNLPLAYSSACNAQRNLALSEKDDLIERALKAMLEKDYRQRISIDQAIEEFKKHPLLIAHQKRCTHIDNVLDKVSQLRAHALKIPSKYDKAKKLLQFTDDLNSELNALKAMDVNEFKQKHEEFNQKCQVNISALQPTLNKHRNINYILANIGLAIAGLGIFYGLGLVFNKVITGNVFFFTQATSAKMTEELSQTLGPIPTA
jgi:serine/threonine-protein kinase LegK1